MNSEWEKAAEIREAERISRQCQADRLLDILQTSEYQGLRYELDRTGMVSFLLPEIIKRAKQVNWTPEQILSQLNCEYKDKQERKWNKRLRKIPYSPDEVKYDKEWLDGIPKKSDVDGGPYTY